MHYSIDIRSGTDGFIKKRIAMLKKITSAIALSGLMIGLAYAGQLPQTGINGSLHDMNAVVGTTDDKFQRTCVFCHTPHNASADATNGPLWNRSDTALNGTPYGWVAPSNFTIPITDPLVGSSRLCMSCHDGSVAVDSHGSNGQTAGGLKLAAANHAYVRDLTITHPIGFKYDDAVAARPGELVPKTEGFIAAPSTSLTAYAFDTRNRAGLAKSTVKIQDTLSLSGGDGYMTCASCHDVHNTVNAKSDTGKSYNYFLRARQEGSAICLSCHIK